MKKNSIVLFLSFSLLIHCSPYIKHSCPPDNRPIFILKDVNKSYPEYAREYDNSLKAVLKQISASASTKSEIVKLREDLNQESSRISYLLKTTVLAMQTDPCNASLKNRLVDLLHKINDKAFALNNFSQQLSQSQDLNRIIGDFNNSYNIGIDESQYFYEKSDQNELIIPKQVSSIWVFLQDPNYESIADQVGSALNSDEFQSSYKNYIELAKNQNKLLIITASAPGQSQWLHSKIIYKGNFLKDKAYIHPTEGKTSGALFPLN